MIREIFCGIFSFKERSRRCDDHEEITHPCSRPRWRWRRSKAIKPWPSSERIRALLFFLVLPFLFFRAGKALLAGYPPFGGNPISALIPRWAWRNFFARTKKKTKRKGRTKKKRRALMRSLLTRLWKCQRGVAAVETALVLPFLGFVATVIAVAILLGTPFLAQL